jgi:hypothetical protein
MVWWVGGSKTIQEAIQQIERNSDRGVAIIAAVMLEEHITNAIKRRWRDSHATVGRMLRVDGPLGNFGPKIDLVFLMGLISAGGQSRSRKSAQDDKWSFCLTTGTLCPTNQERQ